MLIATSACRGDKPVVPLDAAVVPVADAGMDGSTTIGTFDPASGMHLDDDGVPVGASGQPLPIGALPGRPKGRPARPIDVILRSSPPGARAAVDGTPIGVTPTYWSGDADGREHEFTFVLAKYAVARYRFVPITSGVVHARLDPIADDRPGANLEPLIAPRLAPDAGIPAVPPVIVRTPPPPVAPPPTVLTPDAAAPAALAPTAPAVLPDAAPAATGSADSAAPPSDAAPSAARNVPF